MGIFEKYIEDTNYKILIEECDSGNNFCILKIQSKFPTTNYIMEFVYEYETNTLWNDFDYQRYDNNYKYIGDDYEGYNLYVDGKIEENVITVNKELIKSVAIEFRAERLLR